jgi:hypothetical protein
LMIGSPSGTVIPGFPHVFCVATEIAFMRFWFAANLFRKASGECQTLVMWWCQFWEAVEQYPQKYIEDDGILGWNTIVLLQPQEG